MARGRILWMVLLLAASAAAQDDDELALDRSVLTVGHWVEIKGELDRRGWFVASEIEIQQPTDEEELLGTVSGRMPRLEAFKLLGLPVHVSERTEWQGIDWDGVEGARLKVEGHFRGESRFSAREISLREGSGRDRITGRLDAITRGSGDWTLRVMSFQVVLGPDVEISTQEPVAELRLAPEVDFTTPGDRRNDIENFIPVSYALTDTLGVGLRATWRESHERNFDLNDDRRGDQRRSRLDLTGQVVWRPTEDIFTVGRFRWLQSNTRDEDDPNVRFNDGSVAEAYGYFMDPAGLGVDVQVGRQDFDEPREWIYDRNLDGVRFHVRQPGFRLELSGSTRLTEGSRTDRETDNWIAYLSNDDDEEHLAAWVVDRRRSDDDPSKPIHGGLRMLGEWLPDQEVWAELSAVRGYEGDVDLRGWAVDVGTTWDLDPFYVTFGFAHGSGDDDPFDDVDTTHRQTGLHDNNGRFGGVTPFKYYGEVLEPDLGNLQIYTAGVGARMGRRSSLDLVLHRYALVETYQLPPGTSGAAPLFRSSLRRRPDGIHEDLGWEADVIFGSRELQDWDLEVAMGWFQPGDAFPGADGAWVWRTQLRYRF